LDSVAIHRPVAQESPCRLHLSMTTCTDWGPRKGKILNAHDFVHLYFRLKLVRPTAYILLSRINRTVSVSGLPRRLARPETEKLRVPCLLQVLVVVMVDDRRP